MEDFPVHMDVQVTSPIPSLPFPPQRRGRIYPSTPFSPAAGEPLTLPRRRLRLSTDLPLHRPPTFSFSVILLSPPIQNTSAFGRPRGQFFFSYFTPPYNSLNDTPGSVSSLAPQWTPFPSFLRRRADLSLNLSLTPFRSPIFS